LNLDFPLSNVARGAYRGAELGVGAYRSATDSPLLWISQNRKGGVVIEALWRFAANSILQQLCVGTLVILPGRVQCNKFATFGPFVKALHMRSSVSGVALPWSDEELNLMFETDYSTPEMVQKTTYMLR
jgi:hypothetical protein